jgi:hypothetical protein
MPVRVRARVGETGRRPSSTPHRRPVLVRNDDALAADWSAASLRRTEHGNLLGARPIAECEQIVASETFAGSSRG